MYLFSKSSPEFLRLSSIWIFHFRQQKTNSAINSILYGCQNSMNGAYKLEQSGGLCSDSLQPWNITNYFLALLRFFPSPITLFAKQIAASTVFSSTTSSTKPSFSASVAGMCLPVIKREIKWLQWGMMGSFILFNLIKWLVRSWLQIWDIFIIRYIKCITNYMLQKHVCPFLSPSLEESSWISTQAATEVEEI